MPNSTANAPRTPRAKPRKRLRFHLVTWIAMVLVASVFLGLNVVPQGPYMVQASIDGGKIHGYSWANFRGWPLQYQQIGDEKQVPSSPYKVSVYLPGGPEYDGEYNPLPVDASGERYAPDPNKGEIVWARFIPAKSAKLGAFFCNGLLALSAIGIVGLVVEWFARKAGGMGELSPGA